MIMSLIKKMSVSSGGGHPRTVQYWWSHYQEEGLNAAVEGKRGTEVGKRRTLSVEQEWVVQQLISEKMPDQLKLSFALWTRTAVQELIHRRFKIAMPIRTVGEYLKRWGFTRRSRRPKRVMSYFKHQKIQYAA